MYGCRAADASGCALLRGRRSECPDARVPDSSSRRSTSRQRSLAALLSWPRFVDAQRTPAEIFTVELRNGRFGFARVRHLDEAETARPARLAIHEDLDGRNFTKRTEGIAKLVFAHAIGQIANVDIHHKTLTPLRPPMRRSTNGVRLSAGQNSTTGALFGSIPRYSRLS